ncbi:MAG: T9SS type A sorting domain-containing protein, partial [Bacteroidota bacterium]
LTIGNPEANLILSSCDSLTINGSTYTSSGIYTQLLPSSLGCDSILTLDVTINTSVSTTDTTTACDSIVRNGIVYTSSGQYSQSFSLPNGCDSTLWLELTIGKTSQSQLDTTTCEPLLFNGTLYSQSGNYSQMYQTSEGCDSTINLALTISPVQSIVLQSSVGLSSPANTGTFQWWDCDDKMIIAGATQQNYLPINSGNYALILTQSGCSDTSECVQFLATNLAKEPSESIKLYPNPNQGSMIVDLGAGFPQCQVSIINGQGQMIQQADASSQSKLPLTIDTPAGLYLLIVKGPSWQKTFKITKY